MQKILLTSAKDGMSLARDVFRGETATGIPICGKGTVLTNALISRFENMDVKTIYVDGHPVLEEGGRTIEDLLQELDTRFSKSFTEPLNAMLYNIYKAYLLKSMGVGSDKNPG